MADTTFRLKKVRDGGPRTKQTEQFGGTLDSVHQTIVSSLREETRKKDIDQLIEEIEKDLEDLEGSSDFIDIVKAGKLRETLQELEKERSVVDPISSYFLKNADIMLEYYS